MKKLDANWFVDNWKWVVFIALGITIFPSIIYHFATMDAELWNKDLRIQSEERLEKEMKEIKLPPKTAVNKFQNFGKRFSIIIQIRYRTEISREDFVRHFKNELEKSGWVHYEKGASYNYSFCRGKQNATLNYEGNSLFSDGADYYQLNFSFGLRPMIDFSNSLPASCW